MEFIFIRFNKRRYTQPLGTMSEKEAVEILHTEIIQNEGELLLDECKGHEWYTEAHNKMTAELEKTKYEVRMTI